MTTLPETTHQNKNPSNSHPIPRYNGPSLAEMTTEQKSLHQDIVQSRPRTGISGPFGPWLAIPSIARPAQSLGLACRYGTSLSKRESELIILLTAAKMKSDTEFQIHVGEALQAGISQDIISSIPRNTQTENSFSFTNVKKTVLPALFQHYHTQRRTTRMMTPHHPPSSSVTEDLPLAYTRETAIVCFTAALLEHMTVSEDIYNHTKQVLGGKDSTIVEMTSIIGYYTYVAFTLNVFRIPP